MPIEFNVVSQVHFCFTCLCHWTQITENTSEVHKLQSAGNVFLNVIGFLSNLEAVSGLTVNFCVRCEIWIHSIFLLIDLQLLQLLKRLFLLYLK